MWGKILGGLFGMALAKIPGLLLGLAIGHWFDRSVGRRFEQVGGFKGFQRQSESHQGLFMYNTFAVMGHLAKADGRVTEAHIARANLFMDQLGLSARQKQEAQQAFRDGKSADFPLSSQLAQLKQTYRWQADLLQLFLEVQISVAYVDARLSATELNLLRQIAKELGFSELKLQMLCGRFEAEARFRQQTSNHAVAGDALADAYQLLGVSSTCSEQELKRAYKKQMAQHHPDKLSSQGLPAEMLELAKQKTQQVQAAYELIKRQR